MNVSMYARVFVSIQPSTLMVEASLRFWTGCEEVFFESPHLRPQGRETRLADPRGSIQDACLQWGPEKNPQPSAKKPCTSQSRAYRRSDLA